MNPQQRRPQAVLLVGQLLLLLPLLLISSAHCQEEPYEMEYQARREMPETSRQITSNRLLVGPLYRFTANLFRTIGKRDENVIFSPLSVHTALNMLSLGVTRGSQTEKDMLKALGYGNTTATATSPIQLHEINAQLRSVFDEIKKASGGSRRNPKLDMINFAIVSKSAIRSEYLNQTNTYYGTAVRQIKREADQQRVLNEVNKWGKEAGFSNNILPREDLAKSALTLLNGVRVEAYWFEAFDESIIPESTSSPLYKEGTVIRDYDSSVKVGKKALMAHGTSINYVEFTKNKKSKHGARNERARAKQPEYYDELAELEFRAAKIPLYGDISYTIIEPLTAEGSTKELAQLEEALLKQSDATSTRMSKLMAIVDGVDSVAANIRMPGYKYEKEVDLVEQLKSMGLGRIFDPKTADLGNMSLDENLYVDKVKHQAMIDVNEKGIKAAAVTRIMVMLSAVFHTEVVDVNVENPFIYVIRLNEVPLFVGHLVKV